MGRARLGSPASSRLPPGWGALGLDRALHRLALRCALLLAAPPVGSEGMPADPSDRPLWDASCWSCGIAAAAAEVQRSAAPGAVRLVDFWAGGPPVAAVRSVIAGWVSHGV